MVQVYKTEVTKMVDHVSDGSVRTAEDQENEHLQSGQASSYFIQIADNDGINSYLLEKEEDFIPKWIEMIHQAKYSFAPSTHYQHSQPEYHLFVSHMRDINSITRYNYHLMEINQNKSNWIQEFNCSSFSKIFCEKEGLRIWNSDLQSMEIPQAMSIMNGQFVNSVEQDTNILARHGKNSGYVSMQLLVSFGLIILLLMLCTFFIVICCCMERQKIVRSLNEMLMMYKRQSQKKNKSDVKQSGKMRKKPQNLRKVPSV